MCILGSKTTYDRILGALDELVGYLKRESAGMFCEFIKSVHFKEQWFMIADAQDIGRSYGVFETRMCLVTFINYSKMFVYQSNVT